MATRPPKPADRPSQPRFKRKVKKEPTPPPKPKPWERPDPPSRGDASKETVYQAVGNALSAWEMLEFEYVGLFDIFIGIDLDSHASHRAFGAIISTEARMAVLSAAAEAYFAEFPHKRLQTAVDDLIKNHKNFAPRRNDIAHGVVQRYSAYYTVAEGEADTWCLFPTLTSTRSVKLDPELRRFHAKYAYSAEQINRFAGLFRALRPGVAALIERIRQRPKEPKEPPPEKS